MEDESDYTGCGSEYAGSAQTNREPQSERDERHHTIGMEQHVAMHMEAVRRAERQHNAMVQASHPAVHDAHFRADNAAAVGDSEPQTVDAAQGDLPFMTLPLVERQQIFSEILDMIRNPRRGLSHFFDEAEAGSQQSTTFPEESGSGGGNRRYSRRHPEGESRRQAHDQNNRVIVSSELPWGSLVKLQQDIHRLTGWQMPSILIPSETRYADRGTIELSQLTSFLRAYLQLSRLALNVLLPFTQGERSNEQSRDGTTYVQQAAEIVAVLSLTQETLAKLLIGASDGTTMPCDEN